LHPGRLPAAPANQTTQCNEEVAGSEIDYAKLVIINVDRSPSARDPRIVVLPALTVSLLSAFVAHAAHVCVEIGMCGDDV
jgi:hypothetical protein